MPSRLAETCQHRVGTAADPIDIFLDLNGVFIQRDPDSPKSQALEGALEALQELIGIPSVRVSFFSRNVAEINLQALNAIKLPNLETVLDAVDGRCFSQSDLTIILTADERPFKYKNLLGTALSDVSLERALLFDDELRNSPESQRGNLILVGRKNVTADVPHIASLSEAPALVRRAIKNRKAGTSFVEAFHALFK